MRFKRFEMLAIILVLVVLIVSCGSKEQPKDSSSSSEATNNATVEKNDKKLPEVYEFGVMVPLTGPSAQIGDWFSRGLNMAVENINESGGVKGITLKANVQDHQGTAQGGTAAMNQLVNINHVPYVISSFSAVTLAAQPIAQQNKILMVNTGGTDTSLLNKDYLYNNQVMANNLMPALAAYMWEQGARKAAMITSNDAYGDGSRKSFREAWEKIGGTIVEDELFPVGSNEFGSQLTKIKVSDPDAIMVVSVGETHGRVVRQARALGIKSLIGGPLGTNDIIKVAGEAAERFIDAGLAVDLNTNDKQARLFMDKYKSKYGNDPDWIPGTMYEAVYLLASLIEQVSESGGDVMRGEDLLKALESKGEFANVLAGGNASFFPDHSVSRAIAIRKIDGGAFKTVKIVQP